MAAVDWPTDRIRTGSLANCWLAAAVAGRHNERRRRQGGRTKRAAGSKAHCQCRRAGGLAGTRQRPSLAARSWSVSALEPLTTASAFRVCLRHPETETLPLAPADPLAALAALVAEAAVVVKDSEAVGRAAGAGKGKAAGSDRIAGLIGPEWRLIHHRRHHPTDHRTGPWRR